MRKSQTYCEGLCRAKNLTLDIKTKPMVRASKERVVQMKVKQETYHLGPGRTQLRV